MGTLERVLRIGDTALKALPTTGQIVVPAPGANRIVWPIAGLVLLNNVAAAYPADADASLQLLWDGDTPTVASRPLRWGASLAATNTTIQLGQLVCPEYELVSGGTFNGEIASI